MVFQNCTDIFEKGIFSCGSSVRDLMVGTTLGALLALSVVAIVLFSITSYVYFSLAWMRIAQKLKYKHAWIAWIPIANVAMMLQLGGFPWAWIFLVFVPVLGWIALFILLIISTWRILEKVKYPGWLSLSMIIPKIGGILYLVVIGFAAWGKRKK